MSNRIQFIIVLRVLATIFVLVNHVAIAAIHIFDKTATQWDHFIYNGINHSARFAVPCFLMITGYLLLDNKKKIDYFKAFKYAWRMVVILLTVGTLFAMMELYFDEKKLDISLLLNSIWNVLKGKTWNHMWYLYSLIGLYFVVPFLKPAFEKLNAKSIDVFLLIGFVFVCIIPTFRNMFGFEFGVKFPMCSDFLLYFLIGGRILVNKGTGKRLSPKAWFVIVLFLGLIQFGISYIEYVVGYTDALYLKQYDSPLMALYAFAVFVWVMRLNPQFKMETLGGAFLNKFSEVSFGIYVFHMLWINIIYKVVKFNPIDVGVWSLIPILIVVTLLAWMTTIVFRKIPYVGRYI